MWTLHKLQFSLAQCLGLCNLSAQCPRPLSCWLLLSITGAKDNASNAGGKWPEQKCSLWVLIHPLPVSCCRETPSGSKERELLCFQYIEFFWWRNKTNKQTPTSCPRCEGQQWGAGEVSQGWLTLGLLIPKLSCISSDTQRNRDAKQTFEYVTVSPVERLPLTLSHLASVNNNSDGSGDWCSWAATQISNYSLN